MLADLTLRAGTRDRARRRRRRHPRRQDARGVPAAFKRLQQKARLNPVLIFLEAAEPTLVRRFSETRRPHPLAPDRSALEGIREEKKALQPVRRMADHIVDTSEMTVHELRQAFTGVAAGRVARHAAGGDGPQLRLQARDPGRFRPAVRRPLPAEPALRARAAAAHRPRCGGREVHQQVRKPRTSS